MNLTHLTPANETCDALEAAGFSQDTVFGWTGDRRYGSRVALRHTGEGLKGNEGSGAPTLSEMLAHLPVHLDFPLPHPIFGTMERKHTLEVRFGERVEIGYHALGSREVQHRIEHESAVEAAARLYLALRAAGRVRGERVYREDATEDVEHLARAA